jgi:hypothetical protein
VVLSPIKRASRQSGLDRPCLISCNRKLLREVGSRGVAETPIGFPAKAKIRVRRELLAAGEQEEIAQCLIAEIAVHRS